MNSPNRVTPGNASSPCVGDATSGAPPPPWSIGSPQTGPGAQCPRPPLPAGSAATDISLVRASVARSTVAWSAHGGAETTREWMFCDTIVFLLILGFLNLLETKAEETYAVVLWDMIYVLLFFFTFWIVDRTASRIRFLVAYAYLIAVPILLVIWRAIQGVELPETLGWWSTIWPFFALAIVFFVLEIIALVAGRDSEARSAVPAIKDGLFVILYAVLLIVAVPGGEG